MALECEAGDAAACTTYAVRLQTGLGVPRDQVTALGLLEKQCAGGHAPACGELGLALDRGLGASRDAVRAVALLRRACDDRAANACQYLGEKHVYGVAVKRDPKRGRLLLQRACDQDRFDACNALGRAIETREVLPKSSGEALALYERACEGGSGGVHRAEKVSAILGVVVPLGFAAFASVTPTDFSQASSWVLVAVVCLFFATPFAAFWIDKRRAITRIDGWLEAGEVSLMRGAVTSKGVNFAITIGDTPMRVWPRIHELPMGHEATVEFLPTNGQPLLQGVLRINGEDNPYFANAVAVAPPGP